MEPSPYDFSRCKLCAAIAAAPAYPLGHSTLRVCRHCDFHFIDHLDPAAEEDAAQHQQLSHTASNYIEKCLHTTELLLEKQLWLVEKHCCIPAAQCLDVGAGVGLFLQRLAQVGGLGRGVEPSRLRRLFAQRKFGLDLERETLEAPFWQENFRDHFDLITLWDVLEHVNFPTETIRCAWNLLKPGGTLCLDTPSRNLVSYRISHWAARLSGGRLPLFLPVFYSSKPYGHKQIFTPAQLLKLVKQTGFTILAQGVSYEQLLGKPTSGLRPQERIILVGRKPDVI